MMRRELEQIANVHKASKQRQPEYWRKNANNPRKMEEETQ
jgi:hypothetical protein